MDTIEINGIEYKQRLKSQAKMSSTSHRLLLMATMFGALSSGKSKTPIDVDIVSEYELIQRKESKLSSNQRKWVVNQFKKNFEPVTPIP